MILMEPNQTPYDLRWRMFGIDVRVHPMFWLVSAIMGANALQEGVAFLLIWVACVFVSILIHELGHVLMGQFFGSHGHIVLYGFGGLAIGSNQLPSRWPRIAVCFAGPLAGFLFLAGLFAVLWVIDAEEFPFYLFMAGMDLGIPIETLVQWVHFESAPNLFLAAVMGDLIFINLLWGLVNLLPIWPLDGGQISRDLCDAGWPDRGVSISLGLSMVLAGLLAVHCILAMYGRELIPLRIGSTYAALMFAVLAVQSFQLLQQAQAEEHWRDDHWRDRY